MAGLARSVSTTEDTEDTEKNRKSGMAFLVTSVLSVVSVLRHQSPKQAGAYYNDLSGGSWLIADG